MPDRGEPCLASLKSVPPVGPDWAYEIKWDGSLIAEIEFRGWTDDGNLRHASYKGLREVQDNAAAFALD